jgi:hypothetical protein
MTASPASRDRIAGQGAGVATGNSLNIAARPADACSRHRLVVLVAGLLEPGELSLCGHQVRAEERGDLLLGDAEVEDLLEVAAVVRVCVLA